MRLWILFLMLLAASGGRVAAQQPASFDAIDAYVRTVDSRRPDSLAHKLTAPYQTTLEKVRAIYSWIAQHVEYNTLALFNNRSTIRMKHYTEPVDTAAWGNAVEMTALRVLRNRLAICDGYSKLFQSLCTHAGIRSEIITGFAKGYQESAEQFRTNHSWNAVWIDSSWHLLDVTWGSGYVTFGNRFVPKMDERFFLSNPATFVEDHYPEDIRWTLLDPAPLMRAFTRGPFRYRTFIKYNISEHFPKGGLLTASIGDTVRLQLKVEDASRNRNIAPDPFLDSLWLQQYPDAVYLEPKHTNRNTVYYEYVVTDSRPRWLHLVYNGDVVLRYARVDRRDP